MSGRSISQKVTSIEDARVTKLFSMIEKCVKTGTIGYTGKEIVLTPNEKKTLEDKLGKDSIQEKQEKLDLSEMNTKVTDLSSDLRDGSLTLNDRSQLRLQLFDLIAQLVRDSEVNYKDGQILPNPRQVEIVSALDLPSEGNIEIVTPHISNIEFKEGEPRFQYIYFKSEKGRKENRNK